MAVGPVREQKCGNWTNLSQTLEALTKRIILQIPFIVSINYLTVAVVVAVSRDTSHAYGKSIGQSSMQKEIKLRDTGGKVNRAAVKMKWIALSFQPHTQLCFGICILMANGIHKLTERQNEPSAGVSMLIFSVMVAGITSQNFVKKFYILFEFIGNSKFMLRIRRQHIDI